MLRFWGRFRAFRAVWCHTNVRHCLSTALISLCMLSVAQTGTRLHTTLWFCEAMRLHASNHAAFGRSDNASDALFVVLLKIYRAVNSAVECHLHTVEATGSIPVPPTITLRPRLLPSPRCEGRRCPACRTGSPTAGRRPAPAAASILWESSQRPASMSSPRA